MMFLERGNFFENDNFEYNFNICSWGSRHNKSVLFEVILDTKKDKIQFKLMVTHNLKHIYIEYFCWYEKVRDIYTKFRALQRCYHFQSIYLPLGDVTIILNVYYSSAI